MAMSGIPNFQAGWYSHLRQTSGMIHIPPAQHNRAYFLSYCAFILCPASLDVTPSPCINAARGQGHSAARPVHSHNITLASARAQTVRLPVRYRSFGACDEGATYTPKVPRATFHCSTPSSSLALASLHRLSSDPAAGHEL